VKVDRCVQSRPASTVDSVQRSVIVQKLACFLDDGPPSPKFQILPSQLRQTADRAAGSLGGPILDSAQPTLFVPNPVHPNWQFSALWLELVRPSVLTGLNRHVSGQVRLCQAE
jgi:hypothetical protein